MSVVLIEQGIRELLHSREIGLELERQGARIAQGIKAYIGTPYPGWPALNPPPGPPMRRTGDLQRSVRQTVALADADGMYVLVIGQAEHRGYRYANELIRRNYRFVTDAILRGR